jgi:hypothetical protein
VTCRLPYVRFVNDWGGAITCYTRACGLDSRLTITRIWRATVLVITKTRPQDAIADSIAATKLEPDSGLIAYIATINHYWARDPDSAADLIERALELEPKAIFAHRVRALHSRIVGKSEVSRDSRPYRY